MISRFKKIIKPRIWKVLGIIGITPKLVAELTKASKISIEQITVLQLMRSDNNKSKSPYKATEIWKSIAKMFENWFYSDGIANVEEHDMNGWFSSPKPGDPKLLRYASWLLYQNIKTRDKLGLLTKLEAGSSIKSGYAFDFEGNILSWDILISLDTLYKIYEKDNSIFEKPVIVTDLGGGWGRIGYVLKIANPQATYVIIDLPEVLFVSSNYLPKRLPTSNFLSYREGREMNSFTKNKLEKFDGAFLGSFDLEKFDDNSIDFFINVASFQEMTVEQVKQYFDVIDRKVKGLFYTQQLFSSKTHTFDMGEISGYESYPFLKSWENISLTTASWSDLYFESIYKIGNDRNFN